MTTNEKLFNQPLRDRLIISNPCTLKVKTINQINMKKEVISLQSKSGDYFVVRLTDSVITEVISINSKKPNSQTVPPGFYQTEGGLIVKVSDNRISQTKAGIAPTPKQKPLSGIALSMANKVKERKSEISTKRFNGLM
jgi:hypothetical protein